MENLEKQAAQLNEHFEQLLIHVAQMQENLSVDLCDFNKQESNVIYVLGQRETVIMRELAESLRLHVSTMTGIVDKLIEKGLIERTRSEQDRRIVQVKLTETGKSAFEFENNKRQQINLTILNAFNAEERATFIELFGKVVKSLDK